MNAVGQNPAPVLGESEIHDSEVPTEWKHVGAKTAGRKKTKTSGKKEPSTNKNLTTGRGRRVMGAHTNIYTHMKTTWFNQGGDEATRGGKARFED